MCAHEIGDTRLSLDHAAGKIRGEIFCPSCGSTIQTFQRFSFGLSDITDYRCKPNLRGNSEYLGDPDITC